VEIVVTASAWCVLEASSSRSEEYGRFVPGDEVREPTGWTCFGKGNAFEDVVGLLGFEEREKANLAGGRVA